MRLLGLSGGGSRGGVGHFVVGLGVVCEWGGVRCGEV